MQLVPISRSERVHHELIAAQNTDGGWGYGKGKSSWTEPTSLAVLALHNIDGTSPPTGRGAEWLRRLVRADGGVPPSPEVRDSSWVTALVVLVDSVMGRARGDAAPVQWLLQHTGEESKTLVRLRMWLLGHKSDIDSAPGWPWLPGSAAWVMPTAWTVIALQHLNHRERAPSFQHRLELGRRFLLARQCHDGGWNHGASRSLGYEAASYPETTGIALLALRGHQSQALNNALRRGEAMLPVASGQGKYWLALGLQAHGGTVKLADTPSASPQTTVDMAIELLARSASSGKGLIV